MQLILYKHIATLLYNFTCHYSHRGVVHMIDVTRTHCLNRIIQPVAT